ncbi:hypothetical protein ISP15_07690 [Dyella jejuensis]|uniref:Uncharacterized protein n=2 Tax=Dyella jejuensis TaxID=1432009 RepID=A0ABW8JGJ7_9GAMM
MLCGCALVACCMFVANAQAAGLGQAIGQDTKAVGHDIGHGARDVGHATAQVGRSIGQGAKQAGHGIARGAHAGWNATTHAVKQVFHKGD